MKDYFDATLSVEEITENMDNELSTKAYSFELNTVDVSQPKVDVLYKEGGTDKNFIPELSSDAVVVFAGCVYDTYRKKYPHGYIIDKIRVVPVNNRIKAFELPQELFLDDAFSSSEFKKKMTEYLSFVDKFFKEDEDVIDLNPFSKEVSILGGHLTHRYHFLQLSTIEEKEGSFRDYFGKTKPSVGLFDWYAFEVSITTAINSLNEILQLNEAAYHSYESYSKDYENLTFERQKVYVLYDNLFDEVKKYQAKTRMRFVSFMKKSDIPLRVNLANYELGSYDAYVASHLLVHFEVDGEERVHIKQSDLNMLLTPYKGVLESLEEKGIELNKKNYRRTN